MTTPTGPSQKVVPAQVSFLAIYNPSLGTTDDTLDDQIVYYSSRKTRKAYHHRRQHRKSPPELLQEEKNERLRNIGLAQGMVEFGRSFSEGKSVDTVETEKSRIILHELEAGWWLLASIDLTILPIAPKASTVKNKPPNEDQPTIEYSSREVKPPALLLQDLLRAHSTFLLHHASSMSALFVRTRRSKFVNIIGRYWDAYISTWNVMMHGNPIVNVYGGIKLAGSGELGMGVGEEDRGSGEREVLEGFVGRIEGLVDLVVSKFGDAEDEEQSEKEVKDNKTRSWTTPNDPWLGTGAEPASEDGAIFLGIGALSRNSLRDVTHWMEDLYSWGPNAYGVAENPTSMRKSRRKKKTSPPRQSDKERPSLLDEQSYHSEATIKPKIQSSEQGSAQSVIGLLPEPNSAAEPLRDGSPVVKKQTNSKERRPPLHRAPSSQSSGHSISPKSPKGKISSYFKLGYGTHWTLSGNAHKNAHEPADKTADREQPQNDPVESQETLRPIMPDPIGSSDSLYPLNDSMGHFLVGLMGDIEHDEALDTDQGDTTAGEETEEGNHRTLLRTVTVELEREGDARAEADISIDLSMGDNKTHKSSKTGGSERTGTSATSYESQDRNKTKKLRVVIYVSRPFIFTFLFELRTDALALHALYRSLHHQLSPLQKPLLLSTKQKLSRPDVTTTNASEAKTPIFDLIWDPKAFTIMTSIPNIPDPFQGHDSIAKAESWSRIEALNTHMQLLNTFIATRTDRNELERTCKTSRGWWVVWTRIVDPDQASAIATTSTSPRPGTPQLRKEDSVDNGNSERKARTTRSKGTSQTTSTVGPSMYSGPAHPYLEINTPAELISRDKEIFLIRRASDHVSKLSGRFASGTSSNEGGWGSGPAKLAQGIGVDTKRYIEGLLNMGQ